MFQAIQSAMYHGKTSAVLQLYRAKVHFNNSIQENIDGELHANDFNIELEQHIDWSPDLNVLGLGSFNSL